MAVTREEEARGGEVDDEREEAAFARRSEARNTLKGCVEELRGLQDSLEAITEQVKVSRGSSHYDDLVQRKTDLVKQERVCLGNFERASDELVRIYRETESSFAPTIVTGVQGLQEGQIARINQMEIKLAEMERACFRKLVRRNNKIKRIFQKAAEANVWELED
ncbi:uncharacterized protein LOC131051072 [Cryptomeria japonica]|uniref:uncharacterized protein LOC131051072 n=1 Tax=Cryptomeria japonica TaxID=3369 RepID=UPI0027DA8304|nr:uncharacterized protein LOC131051072 [Cryptomeria japonica]